MLKDTVQTAAREAFKAANYWGLIAMATGTGKSKVGVDEAAAVYALNPKAIIVLVVPTRRLRDKNWELEFEKWGHGELYRNSKRVHRICYSSIHKLVRSHVDLLILDEGHNLTTRNAAVFLNNKIDRCLVLTATPPNPKGGETDLYKIKLFERLKLNTLFKYSLDQAVQDKLVPPYQINVVQTYLDTKTKYIKAGNPTKPFFQTERQKYDYLTKRINQKQGSGMDPEWEIRARALMIRTLKSKTQIARIIMHNKLDENGRYIIYGGSIEQIDELCGKAVYHSKTNDAALNAFIDMEINRLGAVRGLNEGINVPEINGALIAQITSNPRDLIQQVGRTLRADALAVIWVVVAVESVDEEWFKDAIAPFDPARVTYIHYKNLI